MDLPVKPEDEKAAPEEEKAALEDDKPFSVILRSALSYSAAHCHTPQRTVILRSAPSYSAKAEYPLLYSLDHPVDAGW